MNSEQLQHIDKIRNVIKASGYSGGEVNLDYPAKPNIPLVDTNSVLSYSLIRGDVLPVRLSYKGMNIGDEILFYFGGATPGLADYEHRFTLADGREAHLDVPKLSPKKLINLQAFAVYFVNNTLPSNVNYFEVTE
ncbi:hypothetical protein BK659_06585 [Pseudomonas brassicacearum]|uniref:Uncharacterized protein n=1 Tax=Pseudomonas brassicacearum TaxID=930166 RepID=A0A423HAZ9_9PSED|nr:hypothetical protein [Pseudomonas brassicacearum]RON10405.1 hypothetical protein BK659_06585 [Pseudomonas brassicacearum]